LRLPFSKDDLANDLFGTVPPKTGWANLLVRFLALALATSLLLILRRPDAVWAPQFWAEDGQVFFAQQFYHEATIFSPYAGYLHLIPRTTAWLADYFPVLWAPLIYNLCALLLASFCCAWISLPHFSHLVSGSRLRVLVALLLAMMPAASTVLLNLTNLQWYLLVWCALFCLQKFSTLKGLISATVVYVLFVLSAGLASILAPIWLLRAIVLKERRIHSIAMLLFHAGYLAATQIYFPQKHGLANALGRPNLIVETVKLAISRIALTVLLGPKLMNSIFLKGPNLHLIFPVGAIILAATWGLLIWRMQARRNYFLHSLVFGYLIFGSVYLSVRLRVPTVADIFYFDIASSRYFFLGTAFFYLALVESIDRLRTDRRFKYRTGGLLVVLGLVAADNIFVAPLFEDTNWPRWALGLEQVRGTGLRFPADIPINPRPWVITGSHELPKGVQMIRMDSACRPGAGLQKAGSGWRAAGEVAFLAFPMPQPKYIYAISLVYNLNTNESTSPGARLVLINHAASKPGAESRFEPLAGTNKGTVKKIIWVLDRLDQFQIQLPRGSELELTEIILYASPRNLEIH